MAKAKFDAKKVIGTLTSRLEILVAAVGVCLVVICLLIGLSTYLSASSPEPLIKKDIDDLKQKRANASVGPKAGKLDKFDYAWPKVTEAHVGLVLKPPYGIGAASANARSNPAILMVDNDQEGKSFQIDYVHQGALVYELKGQDKLSAFTGPGGANLIPMLVVAAKRM